VTNSALQLTRRYPSPEGQPGGPRVLSHRGDSEGVFATAPIKVDETYVTPVETPQSMEMHATVAVWDGKKYTLYESSQGVMNHQTFFRRYWASLRKTSRSSLASSAQASVESSSPGHTPQSPPLPHAS